ncbi:MAG: RHS repeat-associated core domain-containing protein [Phycisphaeraceae bacterium]
MMGMPKPLDPTESFTAVDDAWNRLVELSEAGEASGSGSAEGGVIAEYAFDATGRRIVAKTYTDEVLDQTRHFYYSQAHQILEERVDGTSDSHLDVQYVWGNRYIDDLIARHDGTNWLFALQDANFRVVAIVSEAGSVGERYDYNLYGKRIVLNDDYTTHANPEAGGYAFAIGHQGLHHDVESGLVYNRARMLHPVLGRFIQRDPLDYVDGMSVYAAYHVMGGQLDPWGLWSIMRWLYTGNGNASDELYEVACEDARDWLFTRSPVRGGYVGAGLSGKRQGRGAPGGYVGATGGWSIDRGLGATVGGGIGRQGRMRDPRTGQFASGWGGIGGGIGYSEGGGWEASGGLYGGSTQNGRTRKGGGHGGLSGNGTINVGLNYRFVNVGLTVNPSRILNLFGAEEYFGWGEDSCPSEEDDPCD